MNDVLKIFLEASAQKGEWLAALKSYHSFPERIRTEGHFTLLIKVLCASGKWNLAQEMCTKGKSKVEELTGLTFILLNAYGDNERMVQKKSLLAWPEALSITKHAWDCAKLVSEDGWDEKVQSTVQSLWGCSEGGVLNTLPREIVQPTRSLWLSVAREIEEKKNVSICNTTAAHLHSLALAQKNETTPEKKDNDKKLTFLESSSSKAFQGLKGYPEEMKNKNSGNTSRVSWSEALKEFRRIENPSLATFQKVIKILSREGRLSEVEALVNECCCISPQLIRPSRRLVKCIAESATRLQSPSLCKKILMDKQLSNALTPSTAIPLILLLTKPSIAHNEWDMVARWWEDQKLPSSSGSVDEMNTKASYTLRGHLRLSSHVACCIVLGSGGKEWPRALACFEGSENANKELELLFKLRVLRIAKNGEAAAQVFCQAIEKRRSIHSGAEPVSDLLRDSYGIFFTENPGTWVNKADREKVMACWKAAGLPPSTLFSETL